jgi:hypothetical protein
MPIPTQAEAIAALNEYESLIRQLKTIRDENPIPSMEAIALFTQSTSSTSGPTQAQIQAAIEASNFAKGIGMANANTLRTIEGNTAYPVVATPHNALVRTAVTASAQTDMVQVDVNSFAHSGQLALATRVVNSAVAPGASRSVQVQWAFENVAGLNTPSQFSTFESRVIPIINLTNVVARNPPMERIQVFGRYLYIWLVWSALDAGATLTVTNELVAI